MNIQQLSYFRLLARKQHLTHTAEQLMISPPALSATISRLEEELGAPLFDRCGRNIVLNENGRILLGHADNIFYELEAARNEIVCSNSSIPQHITIGITSPAIWHDALERFLSENPDIRITHQLVRLDQLHDHSVYEQLDLVLTAATDLPLREWNTIELCRESSPCLAVYPSHPFADRKRIRLFEAHDERFISLSRGYSFREYADSLCRLAGFEPNTVLECDFALRGTMLAAKHGIILTSRAIAEGGSLGEACYIDICDPILVRSHAVFWSKRRPLSSAAKLFCDFMRENYPQGSPKPV